MRTLDGKCFRILLLTAAYKRRPRVRPELLHAVPILDPLPLNTSYFEEFSFSVSEATPSPSQGVAYKFEAGVRAPAITTYASDATFSLGAVVALFRNTPPCLTPRLTASLPVCEDDKVSDFHCHARGLPQQLYGSKMVEGHCSAARKNK